MFQDRLFCCVIAFEIVTVPRVYLGEIAVVEAAIGPSCQLRRLGLPPLIILKLNILIIITLPRKRLKPVTGHGLVLKVICIIQWYHRVVSIRRHLKQSGVPRVHFFQIWFLFLMTYCEHILNFLLKIILCWFLSLSWLWMALLRGVSIIAMHIDLLRRICLQIQEALGW